jgi:hypothetical protein
MKCKLNTCQVKIGEDVADVILISTINKGKVLHMELRINECVFNEGKE